MSILTTWINKYRLKRYQKNIKKCSVDIQQLCYFMSTWITTDCRSGMVDIQHYLRDNRMGYETGYRFTSTLLNLELNLIEFDGYEQYSFLTGTNITVFNLVSSTELKLSKVDKKCLKYVVSVYKNWKLDTDV